jgi:hypothetical protein
MSTAYAPSVQFRSQRSQVRLTRRGRLVVFLLGAALLFGIALWLAAGSAATDQPSGTAPYKVVTVAPGDTLWDIADAATDGNVGDMVAEIRDVNSLDSGEVFAGQELRVPVG